MKLLRSSTPWLFSLICGIGVVAVVGLGQEPTARRPPRVPANIPQTLERLPRRLEKRPPSVVS
ncbi:MAG: hypothetical protein Ct9H300mP1_22580 [Planctomycetaceae bacterium]|nr:MAG: hypothetical protein Ct9H300mP1_22580 [Planctomycetaceae bacterium]